MRAELLAAAVAALLAGPAAAQTPKVIELTQVPCQFLESEGGRDRGFKSTKAADCEAINAKTGTHRVAGSKAIEKSWSLST